MMLWPWEWVQVYRIFSSVSALCVTIGIIVTIIWPVAWPVWIVVVMIIIFGGIMPEDLDVGYFERNARRRHVRDKRGMHGRKVVIEVTPVKEEVMVKVRRRNSNGKIVVYTRYFHAENEAEKAHEYVGSLKDSHRNPEPTATQEAKALAKVLK
jgi:hypothetical protein